jgi:hypothetical protein
MKTTALAGCLAFTLAAPAMAITQDLGVLGAGGTSFSQNFVRFFGLGDPLGAFTDYYTFTLASGSIGAAGGMVTFDVGSVDLNLKAVSLYQTTSPSGAVVDTTPGSFSFSNLTPLLSYTLAVSGTLSSGWADIGVAQYTGTIRSIASPAPEPGALGLLAAGLVGAGTLARRHKKS